MKLIIIPNNDDPSGGSNHIEMEVEIVRTKQSGPYLEDISELIVKLTDEQRTIVTETIEPVKAEQESVLDTATYTVQEPIQIVDPGLLDKLEDKESDK